LTITGHNNLRLGLIGSGAWGRNIVHTLQSIPSVALACVVSNNPETKNIVPENCLVFPEFNEMLSYDLLDGYIIATPPEYFFEIGEKILTKGRPIFIEKPFTCDPNSASLLTELAAQHNTWGIVDHIHLFSKAFRVLEDEVNSIGSIDRIETIAGKNGPIRNNISVLWDWGPHDVAMVEKLLGHSPKVVAAQYLDLPVGAQLGSQRVLLSLTYPKNIEVSIELSNGFKKNIRRLSVYCREYCITYEDKGSASICTVMKGSKKYPIRVYKSLEPPLKNALHSFILAINGERPLPSDLLFGSQIVSTLDRAESKL
jgi:predicted dehydrogenase